MENGVLPGNQIQIIFTAHCEHRLATAPADEQSLCIFRYSVFDSLPGLTECNCRGIGKFLEIARRATEEEAKQMHVKHKMKLVGPTLQLSFSFTPHEGTTRTLERGLSASA